MALFLHGSPSRTNLLIGDNGGEFLFETRTTINYLILANVLYPDGHGGNFISHFWTDWGQADSPRLNDGNDHQPTNQTPRILLLPSNGKHHLCFCS